MLNGGLTEKEWLGTFGIKDHIHFREGEAKILKYLGWYSIQYPKSYNYGTKNSETIIWYQQAAEGNYLCFSSSIKYHVIKPKAKNCKLAKPVHGWPDNYFLLLQRNLKAHNFRNAKKKPALPYVDFEMIE